MSQKVLVETSARHVHLSEEHLAILFGPGATLTPKKDLSQPGQFACDERVEVIGPKGSIARVSVLGPTRSTTQIELSMTDARSIGIQAPIRESGDTKASGSCVLRGPKGEVELSEGVIVAKRHLHTTPEDAVKLGVKDKEIVGLKILGGDRSVILGDVVVRVSPKFATAAHVDTDEANAGNFKGEVWGEIVRI